MSTCKVQGCRYSTFHVTSAHQCGKCKFFGHGQVECENQNKKKNLENFHNDTFHVNDYCTMKGCTFPETHKTDGHCCLYCGKREGHMKQCPSIDSTTIFTNPLQIPVESFIIETARKKNIPIGYYSSEFGGMGSTWFIRNHNGKLEYFFMYGDSWGQYGEDTSEMPRLNCFLRGYKHQL